MQTLPYGSKMLLCIPSLRERRKRLPRVLTAVFPQDPPSCVGDRQLFVRPRQSPRHAKPHGLVASAPAKRSTVGCGAARRKSKQEGSQKDWAEDRGVMRCPICEAQKGGEGWSRQSCSYGLGSDGRRISSSFCRASSHSWWTPLPPMPGTSPTVLLLSSGWETDPQSDSNGMLGTVKGSTLP